MTLARRYERLAAAAREAGFGRATPSLVHSWRRSGLVPRTTIRHVGFGRRSFVEPDGLVEQVLALCRLRYDHGIRSHALLACCLWADDYPVAPESARRGLAALIDLLPTYVRRYRQEGDPLDAVDDLAFVLASRRSGLLPSMPDSLDRPLLHRGLYEVLAGALLPDGTGLPDLEGLAYIEEITGLARGRVDRLGDAQPWLPEGEPGSAMLEGLRGTSGPVLQETLAAASDGDLEVARRRAADLRRRWSVLGKVLGYVGGPDFAGLGLISVAMTDPLGPPLVTLIALKLPNEIGEFLDGLPSGQELAEIEQAVELVAKDPSLAAEIRVQLARMTDNTADTDATNGSN
jgi:hypothetical protein